MNKFEGKIDIAFFSLPKAIGFAILGLILTTLPHNSFVQNNVTRFSFIYEYPFIIMLYLSSVIFLIMTILIIPDIIRGLFNSPAIYYIDGYLFLRNSFFLNKVDISELCDVYIENFHLSVILKTGGVISIPAGLLRNRESVKDKIQEIVGLQ